MTAPDYAALRPALRLADGRYPLPVLGRVRNVAVPRILTTAFGPKSGARSVLGCASSAIPSGVAVLVPCQATFARLMKARRFSSRAWRLRQRM